MELMYYSYSRKPTGQEFFVPAQVLIGVKLLTAFSSVRIKIQQFDLFLCPVKITIVFYLELY
jgi:hypothetical protein